VTDYQLRHVASGEPVINNIKIANTCISRLLGLLPKSYLGREDGLWILPCTSIHTVGMRFSIDVIFLDKNFKIIKLRKNLKPFRFCFSFRNTHSVLELSSGVIESCNLNCGDFLHITSSSVMPGIK